MSPEPKLTEIVAKTIVYTKGGQVLLLTRSQTDVIRPGGFDIPGGSIEANETLKDGALREISEEAGLMVEPHDMQLLWSKTT
jgi:8-oxo-dGTP pyrophosphatase MutT (NUDIX family)